MCLVQACPLVYITPNVYPHPPPATPAPPRSLRAPKKKNSATLILQTAYHGVRDSYQFTAELRKVLHSLPPRVAWAASQVLRNPSAAPAAASTGLGSGRGGVPTLRGRGDGTRAFALDDDDDELPYTTQVSGAGSCGGGDYSSTLMGEDAI